MNKSRHFRWKFEIQISLMVIFHQFFKINFKNNLISAEILKTCRISTFWRKSAFYLQKSSISADILIFCWKLTFWTNSQRKWAYFRFKIFKIVCYDLPIRSIFYIFSNTKIWVTSSQNPEIPGMRGENDEYVVSHLSYLTQFPFGKSCARFFTSINYEL